MVQCLHEHGFRWHFWKFETAGRGGLHLSRKTFKFFTTTRKVPIVLYKALNLQSTTFLADKVISYPPEQQDSEQALYLEKEVPILSFPEFHWTVWHYCFAFHARCDLSML